MKGRIGWVAGAIAALALGGAAPASAAIHEVDTVTDEQTSPGSGCSLREAIATSNGGPLFTAECGAPGFPGTITFDPTVFAPGGPVETIDLEAVDFPLPVTSSAEIIGPGMDELVVTNTNGPSLNGGIFTTSATTVEISGLTISGGSVATTGAVSARGGGISNSSALTLDDVRVTGNTVSRTVTSGATGADAYGGGISNGPPGTLAITDSVISNNTVTASSSSPDVSFAQAQGGGISDDGTASPSLVRSTVSGNSVVANDTNGPQQAAGLGGGIYTGFPLIARQSTISGNSVSVTSTTAPASARGGGVYSQGAGSGAIELSTIAGNTVFADGFSNNETFLAGGVHDENDALEIVSSTIADNGPLSGDPMNEDAANILGSPQLWNTIVADPRGGRENCDSGGVDSNDFNVDYSPGGSSCNLGDPNDLSADPLLETLASNGGPTQTILPGPGSPVIDQGSDNQQTINADQRGLPRIGQFPLFTNADNGEDIGAVEIQIAPPALTGTVPALGGSDDTPNVTGTAQDGTVRLFTGAGCTTQTGPAAADEVFASPGITVGPVPHNATTTFRATVTTAYGVSACSTGTTSYAHADAPPATDPGTTNPGTTPPKKKKCKKGRKLKKGKCVKKKRKKR
jgi:hypothetical protein